MNHRTDEQRSSRGILYSLLHGLIFVCVAVAGGEHTDSEERIKPSKVPLAA